MSNSIPNNNNNNNNTLREELIGPAIRFLLDDKVKDAPIANKIAFLQSKGLTSDEINTAITRSTTTTTATTNPVLPPPPPPPSHHQLTSLTSSPSSSTSWSIKDFILFTTTITGISYISYSFFMKYIRPKLPIPSFNDLTDAQTQFRNALTATSDTITAMQQQATQSMNQLHTDTITLHTTMNDTCQLLKQSTDLITLRDNQLSTVVNDMNQLRESVPKLLDQSQQAQLSILNELQSELRSLRSTITNHSNSFISPSPSSTPSDITTATTTTTTTNASSTSLLHPSSIETTTNINNTSSTYIPIIPPTSLAPLIPSNRPKLPDWQIKAAKQVQLATITTSSSSSSSTSDPTSTSTPTSIDTVINPSSPPHSPSPSASPIITDGQVSPTV